MSATTINTTEHSMRETQIGESSMIHRKTIESSSDDDVTRSTDDDITGDEVDDEDAESLVGISIGHAQDVMRSPTTPAAEKAQALDRSRSYFSDDLSQTQGFGSIDEQLVTDDLKETVDDIHVPSLSQEPEDVVKPPSPWKAPSTRPQRSSFVSGILSSTTNEPRKRSSSGSSLFGNLRKMLPELPSVSTRPRTHSTPKIAAEDAAESAAGQSTESSGGARDVARQPNDRNSTVSRIDGATDAKQKPVQPKPQMLRRATSDHSLYLRRAPTGASDFDDYTAFADITEMVNSRFKAITDSLADSSVKIPKLPSISFAAFRPAPPRSNSDMTRDNTMQNSGSMPQHKKSIPGVKRKVETTDAVEKQHPLLTEALSSTHGDLVIMGGYRGSILREAQAPNRQLWVPVKVGLNLRKADLEVGLTLEDELRMEEKIIPDGTLSHIGPIDISRRLIKKCRKCRNAKNGSLKVHDWGYDWRLSPHLLSKRLMDFLESLDCNKPGVPHEKRGAWIVAHSLGGLLTRHVANLRPELIAGVVFAGTPQNCVNILGPLRNGDDVLFSSRVLTAQVNFTLRTSYALMPENGRCFINRDTGERYDLDLFNAETWEEYRLSPCIAPALQHPTKPRRQSLIGSISETISNYTPSLPKQRSAWFGGTTNNTANDLTGHSSPSSDSADTVKEKSSQTVQTAAALATGSPKNEAIEPSMSSHKPGIATAVTLPKQACKEYLVRTLAEVKRFKMELYHKPDLQSANRYPPHALIFGKSTPTVYGAKVANKQAIKYDGCFDDLAFAAGDGVVLASAAQLPVGYRCVKGGRVESERGHVGLLGDLEAVGRCLSAVIEARKRGVGLGNDQNPARMMSTYT